MYADYSTALETDVSSTEIKLNLVDWSPEIIAKPNSYGLASSI